MVQGRLGVNSVSFAGTDVGLEETVEEVGSGEEMAGW